MARRRSRSYRVSRKRSRRGRKTMKRSKVSRKRSRVSRKRLNRSKRYRRTKVGGGGMTIFELRKRKDQLDRDITTAKQRNSQIAVDLLSPVSATKQAKLAEESISSAQNLLNLEQQRDEIFDEIAKLATAMGSNPDE